MKPHIIAHRANLNGPNPVTENTPEAIQACIQAGLDIELDVWYVDGIYYLGHDKPTTQFDLLNYPFGMETKVYLHAKNIETLHNLLTLNLDIHGHDCFIHDKDEATLTLGHIIWTYPGKKLTEKSIAVMPEYISFFYEAEVLKLMSEKKIKGICTDYPLEWIDRLKNNEVYYE